MSTLAILGGKAAFAEKKAMDYVPSWPIPFPETEEKLIAIYRSGVWGEVKYMKKN